MARARDKIFAVQVINKETMVTEFKCILPTNCGFTNSVTGVFNSLEHKQFSYSLPKICFM
jgi:hypothetical protein